VTRAFAIASGRPYSEVYALVNELAQHERQNAAPRRKGRRSSARTGVSKATSRKLAEALGFEPHVATMKIGSGCTVHVKADELPPGRLVLNLSRHLAAFVDGKLRDAFDCSRDGTRCVYGYWRLPDEG
jgi:hypothetical protein